ncbi:hypothetical protein IFM89_007483 [Coptis chinensis]|uniref:phosphoglycerate kinase n=1 Tax=Coptis chinensis TaxID=261450 RepID=A0A835H9F8_9MAGN|nr:hypothetical protein IFM89_007483 [Coptis chinensis]
MKVHIVFSFCDVEEQNGLPHVQTLSKFPKEELSGKVVMVRVNITFLLRGDLESKDLYIERSLHTVKYLRHAGAKVLIASNWGRLSDTMQVPSTETVAGWSSTRGTTSTPPRPGSYGGVHDITSQNEAEKDIPVEL